jgi:hypothetical protein
MEGLTMYVETDMLEFSLNGLVAEAVKILLGNPDVIVATNGFTLFITLCLVVIELFKRFN